MSVSAPPEAVTSDCAIAIPRWAYNTAAYHLLFHILAQAVGETVEAFAERRLLGPLGMSRTQWITSPGSGARGPVTSYYSASSTARDLARFGALVLGGGAWNGRRLIDADLLQALVRPSQARIHPTACCGG